MTKRIDFYFDFISPYSYLAATQLPGFSQKHQVEINWLPLNLPQLMKLPGNTSPAAVNSSSVLIIWSSSHAPAAKSKLRFFSRNRHSNTQNKRAN
nr:DsbA family protein [Mariprofundus aestuarium]